MQAHDQPAASLCPIAPSLALLLGQEGELYRQQAELTRAQIGPKAPAELQDIKVRLQAGQHQIDEIGRQIDAMIRTQDRTA